MKKVSSNKAYHVRLLFVFITVELLFAICIARAFQLQVLEGVNLKTLAEKQHHGIIALSPDRGMIFDRNGNQLAVSTMTSSLYAHPTKVSSKKRISRLIARILRPQHQSFYHFSRYIYKKLHRKSPFVWIVRHQDPQKIQKIMKQLYKYGIIYRKRTN